MIIAHDIKDLKSLIKQEIENKGFECDLNHIDVSRVKNLDSLFIYSKFNGDISEWDVSRAVSMRQMFYGSNFNGDISKWNTGSVVTMSDMFADSEFNGDISKWNVERVYYMQFMFYNSKFTGNINDWKPYEADDFFKMFPEKSENIPYWANYENSADRRIAINTYWLDKTLTNKNLVVPKNKL